MKRTRNIKMRPIEIEITSRGSLDSIKRNTLKMAAESGEEASRKILHCDYDEAESLVQMLADEEK